MIKLQLQRHHYIRVTYLHAVRKLSCLKGSSHFFLQRGYLRVGENPAVEEVHKRLLYIPLFFLVLRMWGTLQLFFSLAVAQQNQNGCIPKPTQTVFFIFGIFQVMGNVYGRWVASYLGFLVVRKS